VRCPHDSTTCGSSKLSYQYFMVSTTGSVNLTDSCLISDWLILQNGADIYLPNGRGQSVLDIVIKDVEFGHPIVKEMLLQVQRLEY
jgi:hypothetical protein